MSQTALRDDKAAYFQKKYRDVDVQAVDDAYFSGLCQATGLDPADILPQYDHGGPERLADWSIRIGAHGDRYGANPDG